MASGAELRADRLRHRVKSVELARAMGVKHPRVSHIEGMAEVPITAELKYRRALSTVLSGEPSVRLEATLGGTAA